MKNEGCWYFYVSYIPVVPWTSLLCWQFHLLFLFYFRRQNPTIQPRCFVQRMALAKMIPKVKEKIEELFVTASGSLGSVDFKSVCKLFWVCLDNSVSIVDLSGLFAVTVPNGGAENLGPELFHEFFKALARVKYPTGIDYCEKLLEELKNAKSLRVSSELPSFATMMDKNVIKILLKFDLPIRKAYSNFCGQSVRVGGVLSWEEVRSLQIGMEVRTRPISLNQYCLFFRSF